MDSIFNISIVNLIQLLIASFLSICLLQSGLDKIIDHDGNKQYLAKHFLNSPLKKTTPLLLIFITILEITSAAVSIIGIIQYFLINNTNLLFYSFILQSLTFMCLFFGQRISKDYSGAAILVNYFLLTIIALFSYIFE